MTKYVCHECFGEPALRTFIRDHACEVYCDFCGDTCDDVIAADLEDVLSHIKDSILREYDDAANNLPYESREGGYLGKTYDGYDLVVEEVPIDLPRDQKGHLLNEISQYLSDCVWCDSHPFNLNELQLAEFSWEQFAQVVKHQRRFYFASSVFERGTETLSPGELLNRIKDYGQGMGLFREIKAGFPLYRVRKNEDARFWEAPTDLGPPPAKKAKISNRMSPAGIPMFYASEDPETALRETARTPGAFSVAKFITTRDILVADFSRLPDLPSIFEVVPDSMEVDPRRALRFLEAIAAEISLPIARDDRIHIEYVPTQVVTEYFRVQDFGDLLALDGIVYMSAANPPHRSAALFASRNQIVGSEQDPDIRPLHGEQGDPWLELLSVMQVDVSEDDLEEWVASSTSFNFEE